MANIERRIERVERRMGIRSVVEPVPRVIVHLDCGQDDVTAPLPGPVEEWVTHRAALEEAERKRVPMIFFADPWREYEARHGLEPGTLSQHELCGKVPFEQLLAAVIGQTAEKGEQTCTAD